MGKDSKDQGEIKNYGQQVLSIRTPEGFVRKSTWQFADVRKPLVSAAHIIQAGNDLFIGKGQAYITNRRKKVLDLFVKVPPSAVAPSKCKPMDVDAINQVADGREQRKRVTLDCRNSPTM